MGFSTVKQEVIEALLSGDYGHEVRGDIDIKNLLSTGAVTAAAVVDIIKRSRGGDYACTPHHLAAEIDVHVITREGWYIKFYFLDPQTTFISVHK